MITIYCPKCGKRLKDSVQGGFKCFVCGFMPTIQDQVWIHKLIIEEKEHYDKTKDSN